MEIHPGTRSVLRSAPGDSPGAAYRIPRVKIVLAPDSFKESLTARAAALAMERGVREAIRGAETVVLPIADGGEGTMETLVLATGGATREAEVTGPLGRPVTA